MHAARVHAVSAPALALRPRSRYMLHSAPIAGLADPRVDTWIPLLLLLDRYASALESLPTSIRREKPLLYMNGWDLFEAHPELWEESVAELPGTIRNLSTAAYQTMHKRVS